jgi:phage terminase large subunit
MAEIKNNPNFDFLINELPNVRIAALQGSTRSGKTFSTLQYLIRLANHHSGMHISICRATFPALKQTVLKDFIEILEEIGQYNENNHNKTDQVYNLNGNTFDFFSLDDHKKVMGRKRDILYLNEALECDFNVFRQLALRTTGKIILDFNPHEAEHWVYDQVQTRSDCKTLISTYKDNPHLSQTQIDEIELLKDTDPDYWKVFGEGVRSSGGQSVIYKNWEIVKECPFQTDKVYYGLDFGYAVSKTAMVEGRFSGNKVYITEKLYKNSYTTGDLLVSLPEIVQDYRHIEADSARPESIEEISRAKFNIHPCHKFAGSVAAGIDLVKRYQLLIDENSINLQRELRYYKSVVDKNGKVTDEPLKIMDDLMDAMRYMIEGYHRLNVVSPVKTYAKMAQRKPVFKDFK